jgi:hypothetical protein
LPASVQIVLGGLKLQKQVSYRMSCGRILLAISLSANDPKRLWYRFTPACACLATFVIAADGAMDDLAYPLAISSTARKANDFV